MLKEKNLRTRRLFRNNDRSLIIAMDHARVFDTVTGLKNIAAVVKAVPRVHHRKGAQDCARLEG